MTSVAASINQTNIIHSFLLERASQDKKWGAQRSLHDDRWLAILAEELGECAKEVNDHYYDGDLSHLKYELVQVGATAMAWLESLMARGQ